MSPNLAISSSTILQNLTHYYSWVRVHVPFLCTLHPRTSSPPDRSAKSLATPPDLPNYQRQVCQNVMYSNPSVLVSDSPWIFTWLELSKSNEITIYFFLSSLSFFSLSRTSDPVLYRKSPNSRRLSPSRIYISTIAVASSRTHLSRLSQFGSISQSLC
jgi:hypothetical protein